MQDLLEIGKVQMGTCRFITGATNITLRCWTHYRMRIHIKLPLSCTILSMCMKIILHYMHLKSSNIHVTCITFWVEILSVNWLANQGFLVRMRLAITAKRKTTGKIYKHLTVTLMSMSSSTRDHTVDYKDCY